MKDNRTDRKISGYKAQVKGLNFERKVSNFLDKKGQL